jgi:hypothetical protein
MDDVGRRDSAAEGAAMMDVVLMVLVVGAVVLALGVDLAAVATWLHSRWKA